MELEKVKFHPWIGRESPWDEQGHKRKQYDPRGTILSPNIHLLVLGESHYGVDNNDKKITEKVVKEWVFENKCKYPFFDNISSVLMADGQSAWSSEKRSKIWNQIAFYNFVQVSVGCNGQHRPTKEMFKDSYGAFLEVLKKLNPTHIWVCGKVLWGGMPGKDCDVMDFERRKEIRPGKMVGENGIYKFNDLAIPALATWHPSPRFRKFICDDWRPIVRQFLEFPID